MEKRLKFVCPECGCTRLYVRMRGTMRCEAILPDTPDEPIRYGEIVVGDTSDSVDEGWFCCDCDYEIPVTIFNVDDSSLDLLDYLKGVCDEE